MKALIARAVAALGRRLTVLCVMVAMAGEPVPRREPPRTRPAYVGWRG